MIRIVVDVILFGERESIVVGEVVDHFATSKCRGTFQCAFLKFHKRLLNKL